MLRLPDGMRDRIKTVAASNNRSMNAEIIATLEAAYPQPKPVSNLEDVIAQVAQDGKSRVVIRDGHELHVNKSEDGRVILDLISVQEIRDIE